MPFAAPRLPGLIAWKNADPDIPILKQGPLELLLLYFLLHFVQFTDQLLRLLAQFSEPVRQGGFTLRVTNSL